MCFYSEYALTDGCLTSLTLSFIRKRSIDALLVFLQRIYLEYQGTEAKVVRSM